MPCKRDYATDERLAGLRKGCPDHTCCVHAQAVVNEDTTADAAVLQKENERLRKELDMYRQLQQVCSPSLQLCMLLNSRQCCSYIHCSMPIRQPTIGICRQKKPE